MKKIFLLLPIFLLGVNGFSQQKKFKDLVGRWEVVGGQDNAARLEVIDSSNIILSYNGERKKILDQKFNFEKSPIWFDFTTTGDSTSLISVKSLIEVVSDSIIKWQLFVDEERTLYFSSTKGELFYLRRSNIAAGSSSPIVSH